MSEQERLSWSVLVINLVIGFWYFSEIFASGTDFLLQMQTMVQFFIRLAILAIVLAILSEIVMYALNGKGTDRVESDERDRLIMLKSQRNGHFVLVTALIVLMVGLVVATGLTLRTEAQAPPLASTFLSRTGEAIFMANLLLLALILTEVAVQGSRVFYYRRGY
jgi:hypothetical protein